MSTPPTATASSSATPAPVDAAFDRASLRASTFTWRAACSLAVASELAYEDKSRFESIVTSQWGFKSCELAQQTGTQCLVAQDDQTVLLAFRGTESLRDALTDAKVIPTSGASGNVHRGFHGSFKLVESQIEGMIGDLKGRELVLTGHSLGGALAVIAAGEWRTTKPIRWIATYGQPAVGDHTFRNNLFSSYAGRYFRFVNNVDIVPRVPPGYEHAGRLIQFSADGRLAIGTTLPKTAPTTTMSLTALAAEFALTLGGVNVEWQLGEPMLSIDELKSLKQKLRLPEFDLLDELPSARTFKQLDHAAESLHTSLTAFGIGDFLNPLNDHRIANYIAKIRKFV